MQWKYSLHYLALFLDFSLFLSIYLQVLQVNLSTYSLLLYYISLSVDSLTLMDPQVWLWEKGSTI